MAGHRYWGVFATSALMQDGGTVWAIAEMRLAETAGGPSLIGSGTPIASGSFNSNYTPPQAFNGDLRGTVGPPASACPWASDGAAHPWLGYDFGVSSSPSIGEVKLWARTDSFFASAPAAFDLRYSDDGSIWTTKASFGGITWAMSAGTEDDARTFLYLTPPPPAPPLPPFGPTSVRNVIPAYPYVTYQDDDAVTAFFEAYNIYAQAYIDWFNQLDLPIYTKGPVQGSLLDWVAQSIYGISRPALPTALGTPPQGPVNTFTVNSLTWNGYKPGVPDTFTATSDDAFRRIITWSFYKGDGKTFNPRWLKRRINRFLNGINGTDVPNDTTFDISVAPTSFQTWAITLATTPASTTFKIAVEAGLLELPVQLTFTITLT